MSTSLQLYLFILITLALNAQVQLLDECRMLPSAPDSISGECPMVCRPKHRTDVICSVHKHVTSAHNGTKVVFKFWGLSLKDSSPNDYLPYLCVTTEHITPATSPVKDRSLCTLCQEPQTIQVDGTWYSNALTCPGLASMTYSAGSMLVTEKHKPNQTIGPNTLEFSMMFPVPIQLHRAGAHLTTLVFYHSNSTDSAQWSIGIHPVFHN